MYLQEKPSTTSSEEPSGDTEEATSIHLTMVYKSLMELWNLLALMLLLQHVYFNPVLVMLLAFFMDMLTLE